MTKKRSTALVGIIALAFVVLAAFAWGAVRKVQLDNSSSDFAVALLQESFSSGTGENLVASIHPTTGDSFPAELLSSQIQAALDIVGPFQSMNTISGESNSALIPLPGLEVKASYVIDLQLGETAVSAILDLQFIDAQWWLENLQLDPLPDMN